MRLFFRFVKLEHTLFSLPIVLAGAYLALPAGSHPTTRQFLLILLAVMGARSAGFALNRVIDKDLDALNPRTAVREIPSGKISVAAAWTFIAANAALFFVAAALLSPLCLAFAPIPLLFFFIYPFLKRFTMWAHFGLGIAWGIAPLGGFLAIRPSLDPFPALHPALLLALFSVLWVAGFDVVYALLDEASDRATGVHSIPARLGGKDAIMVSELFHFAAFLILGLFVHRYLNRPASFALLSLCGALLALSHWRIATEPLSPRVVDFAFFKVNAALGFALFFLVYFGR